MYWKPLLIGCLCLPLFSVSSLEETARRMDGSQGREKLRLIMDLFQQPKSKLVASDRFPHLRAYAEEALAISRLLQDRRAEAKSLKHLAYACYAGGRYEEALERYLQARLLYRDQGDAAGEAEAVREIGNLFFFVFFEYDRALDFFRQALHLYRRSHNRAAAAKMMNSIGEVHRARGEYRRAIALYLQALPILEALRRHSDQAGLLCNLGDVYFELGDRTEAYAVLQKALAAYRREGYEIGLGRVYSRLGLHRMEEGDFSGALEQLQRARAISEAEQETLRLGGDLHNLGLLHLRFGRDGEAERYFELALNQRQRLSDRAGMIQTRLAQATLRRRQGKLDQAEALLLSCERQARRNRQYGELGEILKQLAFLYESMQDAPRALRYQKEHQAARERVLGATEIAAIQRLLDRYESDKEMRSERKRRLRLALLAGLAILLLALVVLLLLRRHRALQRSASGSLMLAEQKLRQKQEQLAQMEAKLDQLQPAATAGKYQGSPLRQEKSNEYLLRLMQAMRVEKAYLDSELSLRRLAKRIGTNTSYLSRILNEHVHMSFTDFVGFFRVEEARQLLLADRRREWDLVDVCFEVGFNSMASFYRAFKRHTGLTPSEFQRSSGRRS